MTTVNAVAVECPCFKFLKVAISQQTTLLLRQYFTYSEISFFLSVRLKYKSMHLILKV